MSESKYQEKRGKQMYGPALKVPKYPQFIPGRVHVFCDCCKPARAYSVCERLKAEAKRHQAA